MNKMQLLKHIELFRQTEGIIQELDSKFGINIWDSKIPNFYNNYNLLIHNLLSVIFEENQVNLIEEFIFDETNLTFDELCQILKIDGTNNK